MSNKPDGGPAFPSTAYNDDGHMPQGITVRDYFAAKAMQGFAADPNTTGALEEIASAAYKWADAMLKARES